MHFTRNPRHDIFSHCYQGISKVNPEAHYFLGQKISIQAMLGWFILVVKIAYERDGVTCKMLQLPKINIAPKNRPSRKETSIPTYSNHPFIFRCYVSCLEGALESAIFSQPLFPTSVV